MKEDFGFWVYEEYMCLVSEVIKDASILGSDFFDIEWNKFKKIAISRYNNYFAELFELIDLEVKIFKPEYLDNGNIWKNINKSQVLIKYNNYTEVIKVQPKILDIRAKSENYAIFLINNNRV